MPYAIQKNDKGQVISYQEVTKSYVTQYKDDQSNPLNKGYILVENLIGLDLALPLTTPVLTQEDYDNIKKLRKGV